MKSLKQIRLVYRQHLLPPLVVPFQKLTDYRRVLQNDGVFRSKQKRKEEMHRLHQINSTVITQIVKIRNNYILPLANCPFYYQKLDKLIKVEMGTSPSIQVTYSATMGSLSALQRMKAYKNTKDTYRKFRETISSENQLFYESVRFLPVFPYQRPADLQAKRDWNELSEFEQLKLEGKYEAKVAQYWKEITRIAKESSIQTDHLIELMKTQLNPPLSNGLKKLLFPSQFRKAGSLSRQV